MSVRAKLPRPEIVASMVILAKFFFLARGALPAGARTHESKKYAHQRTSAPAKKALN